jgi:thiamine transport system permease protein
MNKKCKKIFEKLLIFLVPIIFLSIFFYYPVLRLTRIAFIGPDKHFTIKYITSVFTDPYNLKVLSFTFKEAFISALITLILGFPGAYIVSHFNFKGKKFLISLTTVPFVLPSVLVALGFIILFGRNGLFNKILISLFHLPHPLNLLYSFTGIILVHAFYNFPIIVRLVSTSWEGISKKYTFAAESLGGNKFTVFKKVTLPMLIPAIISSFSLVFIFCFLSFVIILIIGGAKFATIEVSIYTYYNVFSDFRSGSALALFQAVFSLLLIYIYIKSGQKIRQGIVEREFSAKENLLKNKNTLFLSSLYFIVVVILILLPLAVIFLNAFVSPVKTGLTLQNFRELLSSKYNYITGVPPAVVILNSLLFAIFTTVFSNIVALFSAYGIRNIRNGRGALTTFFTVPLAISPITIALSFLIAFQNTRFILNSWLIIVIAHTLIAFPFAVRTLIPVLQTMPNSFIYAAENLGISRFKTFFCVDLNLLKRPLIASSIFSFAISIGEFGATYMLYRIQYTTMPIALYRFISGRYFGVASAMGTLLAMTSFVAFLLIDRIQDKEVSF